MEEYLKRRRDERVYVGVSFSALANTKNQKTMLVRGESSGSAIQPTKELESSYSYRKAISKMRCGSMFDSHQSYTQTQKANLRMFPFSL